MDNGALAIYYGQECGPVSCQPLAAAGVPAGSSRLLTHYGAPGSFYAIAIGTVGPCQSFPGIDNVRLLQDAIVLDMGLMIPVPFTLCGQAVTLHTLTVPAATPAGITFRVQSLGAAVSGAFTFGPASDATTI